MKQKKHKWDQGRRDDGWGWCPCGWPPRKWERLGTYEEWCEHIRRVKARKGRGK